MNALADYVVRHTERGECKCGKCIDVGTKPDPQGHTANMVFFKVAIKGEPSKDEFIRLTREHKGFYAVVNPLDGQEHGFIELGGWIGDQGLAIQYMALGSLLGVFELLTPHNVLHVPEGDPMAVQLAGAGLLTTKAA
jgi:hypothetical protein